ncbi:saccharopine dehydrogenase NADP-binding domain-containing protein [Amycolatopsis sp. NPDC004079]|uniref:saccharopine dehydrogenase NADP-binding domain-containing protein n=1 Tax=Amycolatopsis sp. NPDC004079 TaxID=3154549 RepID=UPI0033A9BBD9
MNTIGIVGATGAVGRVVARTLDAWGLGQLRIGGRDERRCQRLVRTELGGRGQAYRVDAQDPASLSAFAEGCQAVVNCAGPSLRILDRVAGAALAAGADYVDAAGDDAVHELLRGQVPAGRAALISAGMMPGLSALLPRYLAGSCGGLTALTGFQGGRDRFTAASAADYLAALRSGYGESFAAWRGGTRVDNALRPMVDAVIPFFPRPVTAQPFLSTEAERVARSLRLDELSWYTVFDGPQVQLALGRMPARGAPAAVSELAETLCAAAELDLFGHEPYQLFVLHADGESGRRTLILRGGASALTGATAAVAARCLLEGERPDGVRFAGEFLDPARTVDLVRETGAVDAFDVVAAVPGAEAVEEGAL